jgi:acetyl-CoA carboxylase carboxyl transferase subunit alpha
MLENAIYAVASPEACAAILWKDATRAAEAAETMRITAADLAAFGIVDEVIAEPVPAHEQPKEAIRATGEALARHLKELVCEFPLGDSAAIERLRAARHNRFRRIGAWRETVPGANRLDAASLPPR